MPRSDFERDFNDLMSEVSARLNADRHYAVDHDGDRRFPDWIPAAVRELVEEFPIAVVLFSVAAYHRQGDALQGKGINHLRGICRNKHDRMLVELETLREARLPRG